MTNRRTNTPQTQTVLSLHQTPKTTRRKAVGAVEPVEETNVLSAFDSQLIERTRLISKYENASVFSRVLLGETIAAMIDALQVETPAAKAGDKAAAAERERIIKEDVLSHVATVTGRRYSWSSISAYEDAGRVNATLPENLRVRIEDDEAVGTFGTWPLRALGRVKDELVRASLAERLASEGITTQDGVEEAVRIENGEDAPEPVQPKAAAKMVETVVKRVSKKNAKTLGAVQTIVARMEDEDEALTLGDFGRLVWLATPSDGAVEDKTQRANKRFQVFRSALEQLMFADEDALDLADDDGIDEVEAVQ